MYIVNKVTSTQDYHRDVSEERGGYGNDRGKGSLHRIAQQTEDNVTQAGVVSDQRPWPPYDYIVSDRFQKHPFTNYRI